MPRNRYNRYYEPSQDFQSTTYDELEEVKDLLEFDQPVEEIEEKELDEWQVEDYAFKGIAGDCSMADVPADYQDAVKEKRFKILRGE